MCDLPLGLTESVSFWAAIVLRGWLNGNQEVIVIYTDVVEIDVANIALSCSSVGGLRIRAGWLE